MSRGDGSDERRELAQRVRAACLAAARQGYREAAMSGLCCEGAWEAALGAMEMLDVSALADGVAE